MGVNRRRNWAFQVSGTSLKDRVGWHCCPSITSTEDHPSLVHPGIRETHLPPKML